MIVISRNFGQLGNRLMLASHLIAAARHYGVSLVNPSFIEYAGYFQSTAGNLWCRYDPKPSGMHWPPHERQACDRQACDRQADHQQAVPYWKRKLLYHHVYLAGRTLSHLRWTDGPMQVIRLGHDGYCDLLGDDFARRVRRRRPLLCSGWLFDSGPLLTGDAAAIRDYFRITDFHQSRVNFVIERIRQRYDHVIGLHIRRGDYRDFLGGKFYYPLRCYTDAIHAAMDRYSGRRVGFLVASDEPVDPAAFRGLPVEFGTGHVVEDLYSFAACDELIGPPSTYTGWASYYGGIPRHRIEPVRGRRSSVRWQAGSPRFSLRDLVPA